MTDKANRPFDIILLGASGFTGRLVAEYLMKHYGADASLRWAIAGRNRDKLQRLQDDLSLQYPEAKCPQLFLADTEDDRALEDLAAKTRVICTTVGPYDKYGTPVVSACIAQGTDYCDLTGETQWMRTTIDSFHALAQQKQVRIVHCCGFDSIPSDLGCLALQSFALETYGAPCEDVVMFVKRSKGGASGGTVASMSNLLAKIQDPALRKLIFNPYALNPDPDFKGPDGGDQYGVAWDKTLEQWTGPFVMAAINARVVRRSNALLNFKYGQGFRYREVMGFGKSLKGLGLATAVSAGVGALMAGLALPPTRGLLERFVLPKPGEGPSRETIEGGYFELEFRGTIPGQPGQLKATVIGTSDPGYGETAKMLSESAICLATQRAQLTGPKGGILTPATALGHTLIERLRKAGMTFSAEAYLPN